MVVHWVTRVVVDLNVVHFDRLLDIRDLPDVAAVAEDISVLSHCARIALEVDCVHLIVANQSHEQSDVRKSELIPSQEFLVR